MSRFCCEAARSFCKRKIDLSARTMRFPTAPWVQHNGNVFFVRVHCKLNMLLFLGNWAGGCVLEVYILTSVFRNQNIAKLFTKFSVNLKFPHRRHFCLKTLKQGKFLFFLELKNKNVRKSNSMTLSEYEQVLIVAGGFHQSGHVTW